LRAALEDKRRSDSRIFDAVLVCRLAEAVLAAEDPNGAEVALLEGFAFVKQSGDKLWLAELHRIDGRLALKSPIQDQARAKACFLRAIDVARRQEARLLELRAAVDLGRLWRMTGSGTDVGALVRPILAKIEGGETARDLADARELLAECN
jgi:hypothetical protein